MDRRLVILLDPGASAANDYLRQDKSKEKRFAFDQAFGSDVDTKTLFKATAEPLIKSVLQGYNATVFAYGSTGAGKTFTMIGTTIEPGIMFRTVEEIFAGVAEPGEHSFTVTCTFVEVYNENLRDLGSGDCREGILDLREDPVTGTYVAGITEIRAASVQEVMDLLQMGNQRRTTEPTSMNVTSSRSHAVLQVRVERRGNPSGTLTGKLSMIDLAGSERASHTNNSGMRLLEGANINRSLLALGNCINALASGSHFVPYRDSKLTRLLKDSLGGNCRTVMVANISPSHLSYEDTLNTLKYANRAKHIRVRAKQNLVRPDEHVSQFEQAIADLRNEVSILKSQLANRREAPDAVEGDENVLKEASENWKLEVIRNLESRTSLQRSLIDVERGLSQWRVELEQAKEIILHWEERSEGSAASTRRSDAKSLEEWKEATAQIEESIKENIETRRSLNERLQQNKVAGKELQKQLSQRVLNEDLRAFLELIQRVQVLEVERLELEHFWEVDRQQLEQSDQEIAMLREQLRLRNAHIHEQRQQLSKEKQEKMPGHVFLLGSTLAESSPQRGPLRVMQAWALSKEEDGPEERVNSGSLSVSEEATDDFPMQDKINWRALEVPLASQIKGLAQLQQNAGTSRLLAAKAWKDKSLRSIPERARRPLALARNGVAPPPLVAPAPPRELREPPGDSSPSQTRGSTCPPLRRKSSLEAHALGGQRQTSVGDVRSPGPPGQRQILRAQGVAAPQRQLDKNSVGVYRDKSRGRWQERMFHFGASAMPKPPGVSARLDEKGFCEFKAVEAVPNLRVSRNLDVRSFSMGAAPTRVDSRTVCFTQKMQLRSPPAVLGGWCTACTVSREQTDNEDFQHRFFKHPLTPLLQELFDLQDLDSNGLLEESELIDLNIVIATLHYGREIDRDMLHKKYQTLFRQRLDPLGRGVGFRAFHDYMVQVLVDYDTDVAAQEMIVEQFIAPWMCPGDISWKLQLWAVCIVVSTVDGDMRMPQADTMPQISISEASIFQRRVQQLFEKNDCGSPKEPEDVPGLPSLIKRVYVEVRSLRQKTYPQLGDQVDSIWLTLRLNKERKDALTIEDVDF
ncbi:kif19 [Symbiodinium necroappetens]|uniref:Kinesin-like protein KIN-8B n=1 Tax=Symbiodinium necroappetens TaxID=1628268 RepID=A0A812LZF4_9DINO|nr:kif19 [Symbiodinium necroappetens]